MPEVKQLKNPTSGEVLYPVTSPNAVINSEGKIKAWEFEEITGIPYEV